MSITLRHRYPVRLVILGDDDRTYWVNVTELVRTRKSPSQTIVFDPEELTASSLMNTHRLMLSERA